MKKRITLSAHNIFEFSMHHTYFTVYGFIGVMISLVALVGAVISIGKTEVYNTILLFIVALMFTVIQPVMIYLKSKAQAKKNRSIGTYLEYEFNDEGFTISDGNDSDKVIWPSILKITTTKNLVLLYTTYMRAFIIPKDSFKDNYEEFKNMINNNAKNARGMIK